MAGRSDSPIPPELRYHTQGDFSMIPAPAKRFTTEISQSDIDDLLAMLEEAPAKPDKPDNLLSRYRFSASVDTILIELEIVESCKPDSLRQATGSSYVESLEPELVKAGAGSRRWRVKLQDPTIRSIRACLDAVSSRWGLVGVPGVVWLDVALDARLRGLDARRAPAAQNSVEQYRDLLCLMRDSLKPHKLGCGGWRYSASKDERPDLATFPNGMTGYLGECPEHADAPLTSNFYRLYFKTKDTGQTLDARDRRARLECRICQSDLVSLGLVTVDDLGLFKWRKLARFFWFAESSLMPVMDCIDSIRSLGLDIRANARLNRIASQALSRLKL